jgi:D-glycero-alpha-D-manno-heptose-7-phosphate kinase
MTVIHARSPVRFCDLGGWTDTRIVERGYVLNCAAALFTHVTIAFGAGPGISLHSEDTNEAVYAADAAELTYDGTLDLLKAAVRRSGVSGDLRIIVRSEAPSASGLGSSAALGVAAVAGLALLAGRRLSRVEIAREAQALEVEELRLECGVQDQIAAAHGGINGMEVRYPEAELFPLTLEPQMLRDLEARFLLVYTGRSRFSSATHEKVIAAYQSGQPATMAAMETLAACARRGHASLLRNDLGAFAAAINDNWSAQKQLHPDITTPEAETLAARTQQVGALAFKLNGAGSGGTATLLCGRGTETAVRAVVAELGMRLLPTKLDFTGVTVTPAV